MIQVASSKQDTKDDGDDPDLRQLPLDGAGFVVSVVVGNGDGGQDRRTGR